VLPRSPYAKMFGRNVGGQCRNESNLYSLMVPPFQTLLLSSLLSKPVLVFCLSRLAFTFSLHEFYLRRGLFRIKRASLIIFKSHFISILCYKDTLSDVFVPKFVRRKRRIHKFTTRRFTVLGKRETSLATANCEPFGKLRCFLRSLGRKQKQKEFNANTTNSCRL